MKAKTRNRGTFGGILSLGLLLITMQMAFGQTNLQFTTVNKTDEGAIQVHWSSEPHHLYEVDEADTLIDTNTGNTTWNKLYDEYPSQGTNTFIGDFGNYLQVPPILHPKNMPMRFYRIVDEGVDDLASDEPTVSIISPTNGFVASGSLTITVTASTDQPTVPQTKLYVDGQEMPPTKDGSNYVINTCEWGNGTHTLFATAKCLSGPDGPLSVPASLVGHGVSPFVDVTFSNLISRISFSEPFFQPDIGQTQQVSAVFTANCDWTLTIRDAYSNAVRTITGSGNSMSFNWDGTGDGETNIPNGVYYYYIDAQTNGEADELVSPSSPSFASDISQLWAVAPDSENAVPLAIYPMGMDTNNLTIFAASPSEIESLRSSSFDAALDSGGGVSPDDTSSSASQGGPPAPQRPPATPNVNFIGTFGVAYQNYAANGLSGFNTPLPQQYNQGGLGLITMETYSQGTQPAYKPLHYCGGSTASFAYEMTLGGWHESVNLANDQLTASALRSSGSGNPFNQVDIGLLVMHGTWGSKMDYTAGGCEQMYFPVTSGTSSQYVRMSEMHFGGSSTNAGLKWMAISACGSLHQVNWQSMQNQNVKPYNNNLHMILGEDTETITQDWLIEQYWADYMLGDPTAQPKPRLPMTIRDAWYQAASDDYHYPPDQSHPINPMRFATVYDSACIDDYLQTKTNTVLSGSWSRDAVEVWPSTYSSP